LKKRGEKQEGNRTSFTAHKAMTCGTPRNESWHTERDTHVYIAEERSESARKGVFVCKCICIYECVCVCIYIYLYKHTYIYTYLYIYMYISTRQVQMSHGTSQKESWHTESDTHSRIAKERGERARGVRTCRFAPTHSM